MVLSLIRMRVFGNYEAFMTLALVLIQFTSYWGIVALVLWETGIIQKITKYLVLSNRAQIKFDKERKRRKREEKIIEIGTI